VLEAQSRRRVEFEARPIEWLDRKRHDMISRAKGALAPFLGVQPNDFGFVTNATGGINAVLRSLTFQAGDELLTTTHVYNAVRQAMKHIAQQSSATYREIDIPLPITSDDDIVKAIEDGLSSRTRLLVVDHITSPTAIIFPIKRIVELCSARGIEVIIDGAHAPGMLPLNIESINASYYAGNLHKWVCAPPGAGFLWVRPDRQRGVHPTTISHFLDESFTAEFNWQGTRDITPWLCAEDALAWMGNLGWDRIMQHNHDLAVWTQAMLCDRWSVEPASPLDGRMLGSMATVELPGQEILRKKFERFDVLRLALFDRHRIEVPIVDWGGKWWTRPCCQIYNRPEHYERLSEAMMSELK
jgi:isopenicillin-N epimerase